MNRHFMVNLMSFKIDSEGAIAYLAFASEIIKNYMEERELVLND